jgi:beta-glucosidase
MVGIATSIPNAFLFWVCLCCHFFEKGIGLSMMIRPLPEKVLIGYATHCNEHVTKAVRDGVNVVVWSFMEIEKEVDGAICINENSLNFDCIRNMITSLDNEGYSETVHLVSFGGWNGPHLSNSTSSEEWYTIWKERVGDIFHGIDWDLEGHDELDSPTNIFSIPCLEKMGCISRMLKDDGYIVGMAPPQSYLNPKSSNFSRRLTWTEQDRPWYVPCCCSISL